MKRNKYAVGEEWMTCDETTNEWVLGEILEVGDETILIKWEDLNEETEYQIHDMPRIFPSSANKVLNHPFYEQFEKLKRLYPKDAQSLPAPVGDNWVRVEERDKLPLSGQTQWCYGTYGSMHPQSKPQVFEGYYNASTEMWSTTGHDTAIVTHHQPKTLPSPPTNK